MLFLSVACTVVTLIALGFAFRTGSAMPLLIAIPTAVAAYWSFRLGHRFRVAPPIREDEPQLLEEGGGEEPGAAPSISTDRAVQSHHGKE